MYGTGSKPAFTGSQTSKQTLHLYNQQYWEISNLDISANYTDSFTRTGIYIHAQDFGTVNHLYFRNLVIHDVWPNISHTNNNTAKDTGGMFFEITGGTTTTKFNDILIENSTIRNLDREGSRFRGHHGLTVLGKPVEAVLGPEARMWSSGTTFLRTSAVMALLPKVFNLR